MSDYTSKLNLYKVDPAIDGEDTFNIKSMMNDNWDKIDEKVGNMDEKLSGVEDNANNYNHPDTHDADMIRIQDEGGKFTGDNVEDALGEVGSQLGDIANYKSDSDTYHVPTIVGTQIQLQRQSDTKRLFFKLNADLSGGDITISLDNGTTEKNLKNIENVNVTELSKGFVEVVEETDFFIYAPKGGGIKMDYPEDNFLVNGGDIKAGDVCEWYNIGGINKIKKKNKSLSILSNVVRSRFEYWSNIKSCAVDDNRVLIVYWDSSARRCEGLIATIEGSQYSVSSRQVLNPLSIDDNNKTIIKMTDSVFVIVGYNMIYAVTVSGTTVSHKAHIDVSEIKGATRISDNKLLIVYLNSSDYICCKICTIHNDTLSLGVEYTTTIYRERGVGVNAVNDNQVIVSVCGYYSPYAIKNIGMSIKNDVIHLGTIFEHGDGTSNSIWQVKLSDNKILQSYYNYFYRVITIASNNSLSSSPRSVLSPYYGPLYNTDNPNFVIQMSKKYVDKMTAMVLLEINPDTQLITESESLAYIFTDSVKSTACCNNVGRGMLISMATMPYGSSTLHANNMILFDTNGMANAIAKKDGSNGETIPAYKI